MSPPQHPIIKLAVFGEDVTQPMIKLTTGWLLGRIKRFDKRVHTPSSGWGHYLMTYEVISLFVSDWRNTEGGFLDHPGHLPWDLQRGGGQSSCTPSMVEWHCRVLLGCWGECIGNDNTNPSRSSGFPNPSYHLLSSLKRYIFIYPSICLRGL